MAPAESTAAAGVTPPHSPTRGVSAVVTTPVVVVGGGLAGLTAALSAADAGAKRVLLVDKARGVGGNSSKASSGVSAVVNQPATAVTTATSGDSGRDGCDGEAAFRADLLRSGRGRSAVHLVDALAAQGGDALAWLEAQGVDLSDVRQLGGHSHPRTHRPPQTGTKPTPVGWTIISALRSRVAATSVIEVIPHARVVALLCRDEAAAVAVSDGMDAAPLPAGLPDIEEAVLPAAAAGRVEAGGLVYVDTSDEAAGASDGKGTGRRVAVVADAVVLATGGYCAPGNPVLAAAAPPALAGLPSTNAPFASGDGVRLAARLGAGTVDMDALQVHPTGFVPLGEAPLPGGAGVMPPVPPTVFLAPEALRGCGGVLLNATGERFVNELDARDIVTAAMTAAAAAGDGERDGSDRRRVFMVLSAAAVGAFGEATAAFYASKGLMARIPPSSNDKKGSSGGSVLAALAARVGLPAETVAVTLATYARAVNGVADGTGKRVFPVAASYGAARVEQEGLWVAAVTPALHYSMGGLTFSASAEVLSAATSKPIRRLYAAGEVTGGLFGGNRLGGCSLLDCAVFGRIAGRRAAATASATAAAARVAAAKSTVVTEGGGAAERSSLLLSPPPSPPPALTPSNPVMLRLSARHFLSASAETDASGALSSAMFVLRFDLPSPLDATGASVGQYVAVAVPLPDGSTTRRFYSPISRPDDVGCLELLIKSPSAPPPSPLPGAATPAPHMGVATVALSSLRPGDVVAFDGPYGGLPFRLNAPGHIAAVVGGTGVSVGVQLVRHVLHAATRRNDAAATLALDGAPSTAVAAATAAATAEAGSIPAVTLVWAVATPEQLVFRDRMEAAASSAAGRAVPLRVVFVVEEGADGMVAATPQTQEAEEDEAAAAVGRLVVTPSGAGGGGGGGSGDGCRGVTPGGATVYAGRVTPALLSAELPRVVPRDDGGGSHMILCGPPPMCKGVRKAAEAMGYQSGDIFSWV